MRRPRAHSQHRCFGQTSHRKAQSSNAVTLFLCAPAAQQKVPTSQPPYYNRGMCNEAPNMRPIHMGQSPTVILLRNLLYFLSSSLSEVFFRFCSPIGRQ